MLVKMQNQKLPWHHKMMTIKILIQIHLVRSRKKQNSLLIHFNAREQDLCEALDKVFKRFRVEKITIPRVNGRSLYAFIKISWAQSAPVKTSDLCIMHNSGKVQVNSRPITSVNCAIRVPRSNTTSATKINSSWRPNGAGGGRDQLALTQYLLPQLARQEG